MREVVKAELLLGIWKTAHKTDVENTLLEKSKGKKKYYNS